MKNNRALGAAAERLVTEYLAETGMIVLATNYTTPYGEMDIIALERDTLVFIEVKARKDDSFGLGREAVNKQKQTRYHNSALSFLQKNGYDNKPMRFDVVELMGKDMKLTHIKNAF